MLRFSRHFRKITFSPCKNTARFGDVAWSRLLVLMRLVRMLREATPAAADLGLPGKALLLEDRFPQGQHPTVPPWGPAGV